MKYNESEVPPVLRDIASKWLAVIAHAKRHKWTTFGEKAKEALAHYAGPKDWDELMGKDHSGLEMADLSFRMHVNKAFEYVSLFGPYLYWDNPVRTVKPRGTIEVPPAFFPTPMEWDAYAMQEQQRVIQDGTRSALVEKVLNWTPGEFNLGGHSRLAVGEALVKGRSCLWTELRSLPSGQRAVVSTWDSVDFLLVDPDANSFDTAKWIARRCVKPVWEVEKQYGLRKGSLSGNLESQHAQAQIVADDDAQYDRRRGLTNDLVVYYEIWSKMGAGGRLLGMEKKYRSSIDDVFGDYSYLVVSPNVSFPLNLPPDRFADPRYADMMLESVKWPIPYYVSDEWPVSVIDFCPVWNAPWPLPPLMAAKGELRFLNWVMSFLAGHLKNACRDFVAIKKSLGEEIKTTILHGKDLEIIELEQEHGAITDCIAFLQHPQVNGDIWQYIEAVEKSFEKRTGLSELIYGGQTNTQIRSAGEANLRNENASIRPDDMARQVAEWQTRIASKEAGAIRYFLTSQDILLTIGPMGAAVWDTLVLTTNATDAFRQLEHSIEAGSTKRPNKEFQVRQMQAALQALLATFMQYGQLTGDMQPVNNLIADYLKSQDLDPMRYQMRAAPMPAPLPSSAGGNPTPEGDMHSPPPAMEGQAQGQPTA